MRKDFVISRSQQMLSQDGHDEFVTSGQGGQQRLAGQYICEIVMRLIIYTGRNESNHIYLRSDMETAADI